MMKTPFQCNLIRASISLLDAEGASTDSLTIQGYYASDVAQIERVELSDGTLLWGAGVFSSISWDDAPSYSRGELITGSAGDEILYGEATVDDRFDSDAGGDDRLYGYGGDDEYWLGAGTGHDTIYEYYQNEGDAGDTIRIKDGIEVSSVRLLRSNDGNHLYVQLLSDDGSVSDSLTVNSHYSDLSARVESVEFSDGTVWGEVELLSARIRGGSGSDNLYGRGDMVDIFDGDAGGNDGLRGRGGDDEYWLGTGTGHDTIYEYYENEGDTGDTIRIKDGIEVSSVRLLRSGNGNHLYVQLLSDDGSVSDSLTVNNYYSDVSACVESVVFSDGTVWGEAEILSARIRGGSGHDNWLEGRGDMVDIFDSDAGGDDRLHGYGGNDEYWLGTGTDYDRIRDCFNWLMARDLAGIYSLG